MMCPWKKKLLKVPFTIDQNPTVPQVIERIARMTFHKYPHLERLGHDEVEGILSGRVYVFPKLDGTNGSVWYDPYKSQVMAGSRNRVLSVENDNAGFCSFVNTNPDIQAFMSAHPNLRLFGEWMVPHSLKTYQDSVWRRFFIFDVMDEDNNFIPYDDYRPILRGFGLDMVPPMSVFNNPSPDMILEQVKKNIFYIKDGHGIGEGIVAKNYNWVNERGRIVWAKVISNAFKEVHHLEMGAPVIGGEIIEERIINKYVTQHLVDKTFDKIRVEAGGEFSKKEIPRLLNTVYYDLITEEMWSILKDFKNPKIDFGVLSRMCLAKVKELRKDIF
jgi:RNA ligase